MTTTNQTQAGQVVESRTAPAVALRRLVQRFRWWVAAPVLRPLLAEWTEASQNARRSAQMKGTPREWQIECNAMNEVMHCRVIDVELAFGCTSFDERKHYIRHYR